MDFAAKAVAGAKIAGAVGDHRADLVATTGSIAGDLAPKTGRPGSDKPPSRPR